MRNIRLDSLLPDREIASQNCKTCTKRRIKCDRSIPSCRKCCSRGLCCPGYGLRLRWGQGVASRGKLTGKTIPLPCATTQAKVAAPSKHSQTSQLEVENGPRRAKEIMSPTGLNAEIAHHHVLHTTHTILLHHFSHEVAPRLAWLDGPNNPWRTLVLPLAQRSACLRLSTLGLAAAHMSVRTITKGTREEQFVQLHRDLRDASLRKLNHKMEYELKRNESTSNKSSELSGLIEIILTMISLCYGEMFIPNSTQWKLHLKAFRSCLQRYDLESHQQEPVSQFFAEELCYLEAFGTMSSFSSIPSHRTYVTRYPVSDDHFRGFTELLHEITAAERKQHHAYQSDSPICNVDMCAWRDRLTTMFESVSAHVEGIPSQDIATQMGLKAVLRAQYYACLVYCYQALAPQNEKDAAIPALVECLHGEVAFITAWPAQAVSHDISFPLFILGSESRLNTEKQLLIKSLFSQYIAETGFSCNTAVLQFLGEFWAATATGNTQSWIQYARDNEEAIGPFIVF